MWSPLQLKHFLFGLEDGSKLPVAGVAGVGTPGYTPFFVFVSATHSPVVFRHAHMLEATLVVDSTVGQTGNPPNMSA